MRNKLLYIAILCVFSSCKMDSALIIEPTIEFQERFAGTSYVGYTELIGFDTAMKPIVKIDTSYFGLDTATLTIRTDSIFIESIAFNLNLKKEGDGFSGSSSTYLSWLNNGTLSYSMQDDVLTITSSYQQGFRISGGKNFVGYLIEK